MMNKWLIMGVLAASTAIFAQETVIDDELAEQEALAILQQLEGTQDEVQQVNQLGKLIKRDFAEVYFLDRLNADVKVLNLRTGQTIQEQYLSITLKSCYVPASRLSDAAAYLLIQDERDSVPSFDGWMIESSPALSAMDHPRYDVWVKDCSDNAPALTGEATPLPPTRGSNEVPIVGE